MEIFEEQDHYDSVIYELFDCDQSAISQACYSVHCLS